MRDYIHSDLWDGSEDNELIFFAGYRKQESKDRESNIHFHDYTDLWFGEGCCDVCATTIKYGWRDYT